MSKYLLLLVTLVWTLALPGAAQDGPDYAGCAKETSIVHSCNGECGVNSSDPKELHPMAGEILRTKYAVKLTKGDLRVALASADDQVRYLAAWVLADQDHKDVISDIYLTFEAESQPGPKAYLACALAELGDRRGVEALHEFCKTDSLPEDLRLDVVRFLVEIHEKPCIAPIVEGLKCNSPYLPYNWQAQPIIPQIEGLSPSESAQLRALLLGLLSQSQPGTIVRQVAAQTLSQLHETSAIPVLQAALADEPDPTIRMFMEDALKSLQTGQH